MGQWAKYMPGVKRHNYSLAIKAASVAALLLVASCASPKIVKKKHSEKQAHINNRTKFSSALYGVKGSPRVTTSKKVRKGGGRYQVGKPYKIKNKWYYPKEQPGYNRVGMASWYGPNFHGRLTANGEVYDQYALSAAHPTLPLPSYAKVTNLENGSSVIVRINDRGPFSNKRIIDLSAQASKMLGYQHQGLAKVRVRYLGKARMDGRDEKYLMASYKPGRGQGIFKRAPTYSPGASQSGTLLASVSMPKPVIGSASGQAAPPVVAAFSSRVNAPDYYPQSFVALNVPVPVLRPTPIYDGLFLNLSQTAITGYSHLQPVSYAGDSDLSKKTYNQRIMNAFAAIEQNISRLR